jgi:competence protein ComEA
MSLKELITGYFSFSKKDLVGLIVLLILIGIAYGLPYFFKDKPMEDPQLLLEIATVDSIAANEHQYSPATYPNKSKSTSHLEGELFAFDPNTLDQAGWERLGLSERSIKTILNFRAKGGKFYKPGDLQRIWGLPPGFYERVEEHIQIQIRRPSFENAVPQSNFEKNKQVSLSPVNINTADSSELEKLPGIGPKLAGRINNFREKLGGFYSVEQVGETYGLPDSTFQRIKPYLNYSGEVRKINMNRASLEELRSHPYIRWKMANAIVEYRKQHGDFIRVEDIMKVFLVEETAFKKMLPYLTL